MHPLDHLSISSVLEAHCNAAALVSQARVILIDRRVCAMTAVLAIIKYKQELWHLLSCWLKPGVYVFQHLVLKGVFVV